MFFDSHCHLDHPKLLPRLPALLAEAEKVGVERFLIPGVHPDGWQGISDLSRQFPCLIPAFGVHPMHADLLTPQVLSELRRLSGSASAIGEIGLDYAINSPGRELQKVSFRAQLDIAAEAGIPVLIHCRQAFGDLLAILKEVQVGRFGGVMHAFSGSVESARDCVSLGLHISLAGSVTYQNAQRPPAVAAWVPADRLLLETDAPDLAPEPFRGAVNLPAYLMTTASRVAALRGVPLEELGRVTTDNARRLFRLASRL